MTAQVERLDFARNGLQLSDDLPGPVLATLPEIRLPNPALRHHQDLNEQGTPCLLILAL